MRFELDNPLLDEILFFMENQEGDFLLDTQEGFVVNLDNYDDNYDEEPDFGDDNRFISLPEWDSSDGFRLMEHFAASLKNPVVRQELSDALNRKKGVFRSFKNVLEQYPEIEKLWFKFKEKEMKNEVIDWYNSLREEWGLEPIGSEPENDDSLVLEDFILKETGTPNATCCEKYALCFTAENADGKPCGYICAEKTSTNNLHISRLEVVPEYRGMGLGKTLLAKLLEKTKGQTITIDVPAEAEYFSRTLHLEGFKPLSQRYVLNSEQ